MNPAPLSNRSLLLLIGGGVLGLVLFCRAMDSLQAWERNGYRPVGAASSRVYQPPVVAGGAGSTAVAPSVTPFTSGGGSSSLSNSYQSMVNDRDMASFYNSAARETQRRMSEDALLKASRETNRGW